jgi:glutamine synthetase
VIFNGNGYDASWPVEADKRGVWRIDSGVEAMNMLGSDKNTKLFADLKIMTKEETIARRDVMLQHYSGLVEIEAGCMVDMITREIIPAVRSIGIDTTGLSDACRAVKAGLHAMEKEEEDFAKAKLARVLRLETMEKCRMVSDGIEDSCAAGVWPIASYKELLFIDSNQDGHGVSTIAAKGCYTRANTTVRGNPVYL